MAFALAFAFSLHSRCDWFWYEKAIGILPNLLGFSLGGYAVLLAFGDKKFLDAIRGESLGENTSPYMSVSASLAYFVLVQILALVVAVSYDCFGVCHAAWNFFGCWMFIYSLLLGVAATLRIYFLSRMFDMMPRGNDNAD
jgi:hypothetical protein